MRFSAGSLFFWGTKRQKIYSIFTVLKKEHAHISRGLVVGLEVENGARYKKRTVAEKGAFERNQSTGCHNTFCTF